LPRFQHSKQPRTIITCPGWFHQLILNAVFLNVAVDFNNDQALVGSRMYTSMADTDEAIDDALEPLEVVLSSVQ
jgi:hypothetical protein